VLERSLAHVGAFDGNRLVGFVNVAWDGGVHAFLLDTSVDKDYQRQGIATLLVKAAEKAARERGAKWLHVDFEPHLRDFYRGCGFRPTEAGLIAL
jgi:GNAT superfamily N-acetyltransferase